MGSEGNSSRRGCRTTSEIRLAVLGCAFIGYLCMGAGVFKLLEEPPEAFIRKEIRVVRNAFLEDNSKCITDNELELFIRAVVHANNHGVSADNNASSESNWSFGQAFFFAGTVLTTIGYGHVTPLSEGGKVFCIIYAIIGIPLTLIMFSALVERIMILTTYILDAMQKRLCHLLETLYIKFLHLTLIMLMLGVFVFLIPAAVFSNIEPGWNFLDAFYYAFISMTTIGLGDYIPGDHPEQSHRAIYKILTTFYLFTGLVLMMVMLATLHRIPELNLGFHFYMKSDEASPDEEMQQLNPSDKKVKSYMKQSSEETELKNTYHGSLDNKGYMAENTANTN